LASSSEVLTTAIHLTFIIHLPYVICHFDETEIDTLPNGKWENQSWPVRGRTSYPLLFDRAGRPKPAFDAVIKTGTSSNRHRNQTLQIEPDEYTAE